MNGWTEIGFTTCGAVYKDPRRDVDRVIRVFPSTASLRAEDAAAAHDLMRMTERAK